MLCKIFQPEEIEVVDAPWRRPPEPGAPPKLRGQVARGEVAQLREQIEQFDNVMEQRVRASWDEGFRAGEAAKGKSLDDQLRAEMERLAATISEVAATRPETIRRAEADTVRLAIEIARRVLHRELALDPSALEALVKAAIVKLQNQEIYKIRVHPENEKLMRTCLEQGGRGSGVEIICDPGQPRGGVSFEISRGTLDASVDTQLREIENGLVDQLGRRA